MKITTFAACIAGALAAVAPASAPAAVTINIREVAGDVLVTTRGSLDLRGLTRQGLYGLYENMTVPSRGILSTGAHPPAPVPNSSLLQGWTGFTGPAGFGGGRVAVAASSGRGARFGMNAATFPFVGRKIPYVFLDQAYRSGDSLAGQASYDGASFATLGLAAGRYVYTSRFDSITITIGSVPEPATWGMMIAGFGLIGGALRRRRDQTMLSASAS